MNETASHRDAPDDPRLPHQVHEGVLDLHQDVGGHPVAAALLDVGAGGVRVVSTRRGRSGGHGAVAHRTGTRTGLWGQPGVRITTDRLGPVPPGAAGPTW